ncbi:MBL fold metallo-hydrolase [Acuticoccus mangrovi]|uniref:MBL fold metallo-hydrolase n=1 Tax=Acuticoccus mangrovi TaxID=2796142 RepID=A0A934MI69_9HYPH|nr:MBL fold metallo-hydrolase [Acuticoccus mangrovi]MBJ3778438.1 MBL fold metallo-hydrolase [Acuticoccus mangrovi]
MERVRAEDWYTVRRLDDDVTLIYEPYVIPFARCNIWHVRGRDADLLVDSGSGVVSLREQVPLLTEKTCLAVASHTHFDHIGCHHEFEHRLVHAAEAEILAHPDNRATLADPYVDDKMFIKLPPAPFTADAYGIKGRAATRILADGDVVDLGDRSFEVIHTPGHSPGGIALWEAATGILFSGDIVYDGELLENTYHANAADYLASMKRLLEVPVRVVHAGHCASYGRERHRRIIGDWLAQKEAAAH